MADQAAMQADTSSLARAKPISVSAMQSLTGRILIVLVAMLLAMLGAAGYLGQQRRQDNVRNAMERVSATAQLVAQEQRSIVAYTLQFLEFITQAPEVRELRSASRCSAFLAEKLKREMRFTNIAIVALDGDLLCSAVQTAGVVNISDREYFRKVMEVQGPVVGSAVFGRATGRWTLPFVAPVRGSSGHMETVFLASLDLQWVTDQLRHGQYQADARAGLIDDKGLVLVRFPDPDNWVGRDASQTTFFKTLRERNGTGSGEAAGFDGVPRLYGFARFAETVSGPIYLWVGIGKESLLENAERQFAWTVSGTLALAALALGLVWAGGQRLILLPVRAMSDAARRLGQGDLGARTGLRYANNELGRLARAFDAMADRVASREAQIRESQIELETRARALREAQAAALNIMEDAVEAREKAEKNEAELGRRSAELAFANRQLDAANKELEAFAYSVSHDLRAPLRTIDGFSQALLEDYGEKVDAEGQDFLRRVRAAAQRMAQLIDDILQLSRVTRAELERTPVNLTAMAREIEKELRAAQPQRAVEFVVQEDLSAEGDPRLLRRVLENLLGNAWKFTGRHPSARIEFGSADMAGGQAYYVRDDGAGFDMQYADKLFQAFQRLHTSEEFPGSGIGLAIVQRVVHRHGGKIWAEGKVDGGASFYFTLG